MTEETSRETVTVRVDVAVDVMVVVEETSCATTRSGSRRRVEMAGSFISAGVGGGMCDERADQRRDGKYMREIG